MIRRLPVLLCLFFLAVEIRGQDFSLDEALDDITVETTPKKPLTPTKKPDEDDGFDLGDAIGHNDPKPTPKPKPGGGGGAGGKDFGDDDLFDPNKPLPNEPNDRNYQPSTDGQEQKDGEQKNNMIAGIVGAVGAAAIGAVSSFIAYQKKKLCFKQSGDDPENVNMDSHKGEQADPQAQSTLLAK